MNKDIMYLSNTLIYKNALISGNEQVNESKLTLDFSQMYEKNNIKFIIIYQFIINLS